MANSEAGAGIFMMNMEPLVLPESKEELKSQNQGTCQMDRSQQERNLLPKLAQLG